MKTIQEGLTLESRRMGRWEAKAKELKGTQAMTLGRERSRRKGPGHRWGKPGEGILGMTSCRAVGGWKAGDNTQHIGALPSSCGVSCSVPSTPIMPAPRK